MDGASVRPMRRSLRRRFSRHRHFTRRVNVSECGRAERYDGTSGEQRSSRECPADQHPFHDANITRFANLVQVCGRLWNVLGFRACNVSPWRTCAQWPH
jgi:hypothetical protein